ncbi:MAG: hypothetical protein QT11_C0001G0067 [archaeon GW2011_AR20]|nr:MAG: hypothetical protein QT11_C0001G0067 [archaeon GW2011_AR20]MBS3160755.1 hypothetical protein [Candidatus Woesearchaeota archaeon]
MFKKAQATYADFLIGLLVLIAITFIFTQTIIDLNSREDKFQELITDGTAISSSFMSSAYGSYNWAGNQPTGRLGFVRDGKVIKEDFDDYLNLLNTQDGYKKSTILLGTRNDYVFYFEFDETKLNYGGKEVYGKYDDVDEIESSNVIKINRVVYYDLDGRGRIVKLVVLVF